LIEDISLGTEIAGTFAMRRLRSLVSRTSAATAQMQGLVHRDRITRAEASAIGRWQGSSLKISQ